MNNLLHCVPPATPPPTRQAPSLPSLSSHGFRPQAEAKQRVEDEERLREESHDEGDDEEDEELLGLSDSEATGDPDEDYREAEVAFDHFREPAGALPRASLRRALIQV